jgi:hypothetical protein
MFEPTAAKAKLHDVMTFFGFTDYRQFIEEWNGLTETARAEFLAGVAETLEAQSGDGTDEPQAVPIENTSQTDADQALRMDEAPDPEPWMISVEAFEEEVFGDLIDDWEDQPQDTRTVIDPT